MLCLNACQKDDVKPTDETAIEKYNLELMFGNMLNFDDQSEFEKIINSVSEGDINIVLPSDFKSLNGLRESILKGEDSQVVEDTLIESDALKQLLNQDREIRIGDIIYRITANGTFFASFNHYSELIECTNKEFKVEDYLQISNSQLKSTVAVETSYYTNIESPDVNMYDTFRMIENPDNDPFQDDDEYTGGGSGGGTGGGGTPPAIPEPKDDDYIVTYDMGTFVGKLWDSIWGFAISKRNNFDSKNRVDVKFYSQNFGFYSEAGVKTKTQHKGWTGIWTKQSVDEIRCGYETLILEETWPSSIIPTNINPLDNQLPKIDVGHGSYYVMGKGETEYDSEKVVFTVFLLGLDLDVTQKHISEALFESLKAAGEFANRNKKQVGIRIVDPYGDLRKTVYIAWNEEIIKNNTDKFTYIIKKDWGGVIGYTFNTGSPGFDMDNIMLSMGAPELRYKKNTNLYGVARKGSTWKGVRFIFE